MSAKLISSGDVINFTSTIFLIFPHLFIPFLPITHAALVTSFNSRTCSRYYPPCLNSVYTLHFLLLTDFFLCLSSKYFVSSFYFNRVFFSFFYFQFHTFCWDSLCMRFYSYLLDAWHPFPTSVYFLLFGFQYVILYWVGLLQPISLFVLLAFRFVILFRAEIKHLQKNGLLLSLRSFTTFSSPLSAIIWVLSEKFTARKRSHKHKYGMSSKK